MLHEARDRQKFVSDVQYLRDMQHKTDSEYQTRWSETTSFLWNPGFHLLHVDHLAAIGELEACSSITCSSVEKHSVTNRSQFQACLRRQEYRKDLNEKKRDQFWGQETSERSRFSSGSSSKQSSSEEDSLTEPRSSTKVSVVKCDSRLPAIDQTSVKQKHKSTMTPKKTEKVGPSKPSPVAQAPKILSRKRRPNLGRLTISPELHSPRASEERGRQKSQFPAKVPALLGADPGGQQEGPMYASETKLKRPPRERRNLASSSQLLRMAEKAPVRAKKGDPSALSQCEPPSALSQTFQVMTSPQVLSEARGPPPIPTTMGGPRRAPFRFRDDDFYSTLSLNSGNESYDTEEETHVEEELLLASMHSPYSPSNQKRSRFLRTSATQAKNKNFEENAEICRDHSLRSELNHSSLRISSGKELMTKQSSTGQRMFQDPRPPEGESAQESGSGGSDDEQKTFHLRDTRSEPRQDDGLHPEDISADYISVDDRLGVHDYERDWQDYLSGSRQSFDDLLSARPTAPRSSMSSSYRAPGSSAHPALIDNVPADLVSSTLVHSSDPEENSRFSARRPLSPIRNRNPFVRAESHNYSPVNSAHEFDIRGAEDITLTSQPQGAPLHAEDLLLNPQRSLSLVASPSSSPSRRNLQGHLHALGSLQENIPFTFFAVSDFPNQNDVGTSMGVSGSTDEKGATEVKADPEKLKKLQESLLEEDSEEEGDLCRICQIAGGSPTNPLLEPCGCVGSLQFVHQECLKKWLKVKITSGADLGTVKTCEICKQGLLVDLDDFNMTEFYQKHQQSRAQNELMNSGLYLVLLLHLYEQRFAELMRLNYRRAARERLSRNYPQPRPEENENPEPGDGNESSMYSGRVV